MPNQNANRNFPPQVRWDESISVGIKEIDDQHKRLIGIANKLIRALHSGLADKMIASIVKDLREYTIQHFSDEERFMQKIGYPRQAEHHKEHLSLTKRVKEYQNALYRGGEITPAEIREFIKDWLIGHILRLDGRIAEFVREKQSLSAGTGNKAEHESNGQAAEAPSEPEPEAEDTAGTDGEAASGN